MSASQSNSSSQSGPYGTPNSSQLPPQQGTDDGTSQTQNIHSAQNGIANTSEPPSASTAEFMQLSNDPEILALHDAIAGRGQPDGVGETHPAGENANNVSRDQPTPTNLDNHLRVISVEERQRWQEISTGQPNSTTNPSHPQYIAPATSNVGPPSHSGRTPGDGAASDFNYPSAYVPYSSDGPNTDYNILIQQMGLVPSDQTSQDTSPPAANGVEGSTQNGVPDIGSNNVSHDLSSVREVENDYSHLPSVSVSDLQLGPPSEEMIAVLERLSHYPEDEASNAAPGEGPTASSQADQNNVRSGNAGSPVDQTSAHMSGLQLGTQTDDDSEGEASGAPGEETTASSQADLTTPGRNRRGVRRVGRLRRTIPEETEAFFREFSDSGNDKESA